MSQRQISWDSSEGQNAPKRKRASKPKVKTGCIVCKIRRVKCDETKPSCLRCTSTGRKCDGYEQQPGQLAATRRDRTEADQFSATLNFCSPNKIAIPRQYSVQALPSADVANTSFDFFRCNTVASIERGHGYRIWTNVVLELSQSVPAVKLAAAALGTLSRRMKLIEAYRSKSALGIVIDEARSLQSRAELEYARALRSLREHLSHSDDDAAETGLVSCWLMYAFEFMRGNGRAAIIHQVSGMAILRRHLRETEVRGFGSRITSLRLQITKVFDAWDLRTTVWLGLKYSLTEMIASATQLASVPSMIELNRCSIMIESGFKDLREASLAQRQILISIMFLRHRHNTWLVVEEDHSFLDLEAERQRLLSELALWHIAFDECFSESRIVLSVHDRQCATLLKISSHAAWLHLNTLLQPSEPEAYAPLAAELTAILDLAEGLLRPTNIMSSHDSNSAISLDDPATSTFDIGLIQPLYHVAVKAQQDDIRARAIELLEREPWEEGGFQSRQAAALARKFTETWEDWRGPAERIIRDKELSCYHQGHLVPMIP